MVMHPLVGPACMSLCQQCAHSVHAAAAFGCTGSAKPEPDHAVGWVGLNSKHKYKRHVLAYMSH